MPSVPANSRPGEKNAVVGEDGTVYHYDEDGCYIPMSGGDPNWRNNNPFGLPPMAGDGSTGTNNGKATYDDPQDARDAAKELLFRDESRDMYRNLDLYRRDVGDQGNLNQFADVMRGLLGSWGLGGNPTDPLAVKPSDLTDEQKEELLDAMAGTLPNLPGEEGEMVCPDSDSTSDDDDDND